MMMMTANKAIMAAIGAIMSSALTAGAVVAGHYWWFPILTTALPSIATVVSVYLTPNTPLVTAPTTTPGPVNQRAE
jgi:hypothetical protein